MDNQAKKSEGGYLYFRRYKATPIFANIMFQLYGLVSMFIASIVSH